MCIAALNVDCFVSKDFWASLAIVIAGRYRGFLCSDDGWVAIRSGGLYLVPCKAGPVVPVDVAPDEPLTRMRWIRGKPVPREANVTRVAEITKLMGMDNHYLAGLNRWIN